MFVPDVRLPPEISQTAWKYSVVVNVVAKLLITAFCVELFSVADTNDVPRTFGVDDLYKVTVTVTPTGIATVDDITPSNTITFCPNGIPTTFVAKFAMLVPGDR